MHYNIVVLVFTVLHPVTENTPIPSCTNFLLLFFCFCFCCCRCCFSCCCSSFPSCRDTPSSIGNSSARLLEQTPRLKWYKARHRGTIRHCHCLVGPTSYATLRIYRSTVYKVHPLQPSKLCSPIDLFRDPRPLATLRPYCRPSSPSSPACATRRFRSRCGKDLLLLLPYPARRFWDGRRAVPTWLTTEWDPSRTFIAPLDRTPGVNGTTRHAALQYTHHNHFIPEQLQPRELSPSPLRRPFSHTRKLVLVPAA